MARRRRAPPGQDADRAVSPREAGDFEMTCPLGGICPTDCDRTQSGCRQVFETTFHAVLRDLATAAEIPAELFPRPMHCANCGGQLPGGCTCLTAEPLARPEADILDRIDALVDEQIETPEHFHQMGKRGPCEL